MKTVWISVREFKSGSREIKGINDLNQQPLEWLKRVIEAEIEVRAKTANIPGG